MQDRNRSIVNKVDANKDHVNVLERACEGNLCFCGFVV